MTLDDIRKYAIRPNINKSLELVFMLINYNTFEIIQIINNRSDNFVMRMYRKAQSTTVGVKQSVGPLLLR